MAEFLVETYASREAAKAGGVRFEDVARAADRVSEHAIEVRLLLAVYVPEEESCLYLCESPSAGAVLEALTRAGLALQRMTKSGLCHGTPIQRSKSPIDTKHITRPEETS